MILVRPAQEQEIEWINSRYDEVGFLHSCFNEEVIAIAEHEGVKAGLGRLFRIDSINLELGGIYVFPSFRNRGIAKGLVTFLLEKVLLEDVVYCIPFTHLVPFYKKFGFTHCDVAISIPKHISDKYAWCTSQYRMPTDLLVFKKHKKKMVLTRSM